MDFTCPDKLNFQCNRCGLCCGNTEGKTRHILILETEAQRISSNTSLPTRVFSEIIEGKQPYRFEMKKTDEGKCYFLKDNQCAIYEFRPLICMFYPFELTPGLRAGEHVFDFTIECPGINQGKTFARKDFQKLFEIAQEKLR